MSMRRIAHSKALAGAVGLALAAVLLTGCWFLPISIDQEDDGGVRTIQVGDVIRIELAGNISTGHQWIRAEPASLVGAPLESIKEGTYKQDDPDVCGGPGTFLFAYRAVASGTIELEYIYALPWELDPVDTFSIIVWVK
jgi:predicted secreted protein